MHVHVYKNQLTGIISCVCSTNQESELETVECQFCLSTWPDEQLGSMSLIWRVMHFVHCWIMPSFKAHLQGSQ